MPRNPQDDETLLRRRLDQLQSPQIWSSWRSRLTIGANSSAISSSERASAARVTPQRLDHDNSCDHRHAISSAQETHQSSGSSYEFFEQIGEDEWSVDHAAYDPQLNRDVMIRVLRPEFAADRSVADEFWNRAICLAQVEQTHIARIYSVDRARGWIVMERLTRSVEDQLVENGPLTTSQARDLMKQALSGLAAVHDRGEVHGGVCLASLKYASDGTLKLTDANGFTPAREMSLPGGQQRQFAPEMASSAEFGNIGPATDLYCLGFAILQTLLGKRFDAIVNQGVLTDSNPSRAWFRWHASPRQKLAPLEELLPGLPDDLRDLLTSMTQKRVTLRPQSARDVLQRLSSAHHISYADRPSPQVAAQESSSTSSFGPGAVMVGRFSSVYSEAAELAAEPDWLTLMTDVDWIITQIQRPRVLGTVAVLLIAMFGMLMLGKTDPVHHDTTANATSQTEDANNSETQDPESLSGPDQNSDTDIPVGEKNTPAQAPPPTAPQMTSKPPARGTNHDDTIRKRIPQVDSPPPAVDPLVSSLKAWPIDCGSVSTPEAQAEGARLIRQLLEGAVDGGTDVEQDAIYQQLCRLAEYDPRSHYAYGLVLLVDRKRERRNQAMEVLQLAMDVQERRRSFTPDHLMDGPRWYLAPERERIRLLLNLPDREDRLEEVSEALIELARRTTENTSGPGSLSEEDKESIRFIGVCQTWMNDRFPDLLQRRILVEDWSQRVRSRLTTDGQTIFTDACNATEHSLSEQIARTRETHRSKGVPFDQISPPDIWRKCEQLRRLIPEPQTAHVNVTDSRR